MKKTTLLIIVVFTIGWISSSYSAGTESNKCRTVPLENPDGSSFFGKVSYMKNGAWERISPQDRIKEDQIHVFEDQVIIDLPGAEWASFTDTNSMDPVIDEGMNAIEIIPDSPEDIHVGDIVSYHSELAGSTIIHRVVATGHDSKGWYATFRGDNLSQDDPEKVRFDQVRRVVVAVIY